MDDMDNGCRGLVAGGSGRWIGRPVYGGIERPIRYVYSEPPIEYAPLCDNHTSTVPCISACGKFRPWVCFAERTSHLAILRRLRPHLVFGRVNVLRNSPQQHVHDTFRSSSFYGHGGSYLPLEYLGGINLETISSPLHINGLRSPLIHTDNNPNHKLAFTCCNVNASDTD